MESNEKYDVPPPSYEEAAQYKAVDPSQIDAFNPDSDKPTQNGVNEEEIKREKKDQVNNQPLMNNHTPIITTQPTPVATYTAVDGGGTTHIVDDSCCTACWCFSWFDRPVCLRCNRCNCDSHCCEGDGDDKGCGDGCDCDCDCCGNCGDLNCDCDCSGCSGCDLGGCDCSF